MGYVPHDSCMIQLSERSSFAHEAPRFAVIGAGHDLHGDWLFRLPIPRLVDDAHRALTDLVLELEPSVEHCLRG